MDSYERIKLLGKGSFGKVYLMRDRRSRDLVCVKSINVRGIPPKERDAVKLEVALMRKLDHPNIVRYHQSVLLRDRGVLNIVMEFCDGGDLEAMLKKQSRRQQSRHRGAYGARAVAGGLPESEYMPLFAQVALGVEYLHSQRVLHRDLKSQNIFLLGNGRLVLGDLGISKVLDGTLDMARTKIGTPYYMAPEIFRDDPYSAKADIWALGCVLYEMATGAHAFEAGSMAELMRKVMAGRHGPLPSSQRISAPLRALLLRMLSVSASQRPTAVQVLKDPAVRSHVRNFLVDTLARPTVAPGGGTANLQSALRGADSGAVPEDSAAARQAASLRAQLRRLGIDHKDLVAEADSGGGGAPPPANHQAKARPSIRPMQPTASPPHASNPVPVQAHRQRRRQAPAQQAHLVDRRRHVQQRLAREEMRQKQVQAALQRLRRERAQLLADRERRHGGGGGHGRAGAAPAAGFGGLAMAAPRRAVRDSRHRQHQHPARQPSVSKQQQLLQQQQRKARQDEMPVPGRLVRGQAVCHDNANAVVRHKRSPVVRRGGGGMVAAAPVQRPHKSRPSQPLPASRARPVGGAGFGKAPRNALKENAYAANNHADAEHARQKQKGAWVHQGREIASDMDKALARAAARRRLSKQPAVSPPPRQQPALEASPSPPAPPSPVPAQPDDLLSPVPGGGAAGATDDIADDALNEREQQLQNELGQSTRMCRDLRMELAKARECLQDGDLRGADLVED